MGNGNIPGRNGNLLWVAEKNNGSKLRTLKITVCFCALLESPSRGIDSTAKSQADSEPQARGQAGEEGGNPALHLFFQIIPAITGPL